MFIHLTSLFNAHYVCGIILSYMEPVKESETQLTLLESLDYQKGKLKIQTNNQIEMFKGTKSHKKDADKSVMEGAPTWLG